MFVLESPAFQEKSDIPPQYTCDGANVSPPLRWSGTPEGTKSLALIVDDPDAPDPAAPVRTFTHWVAYDLPPTVDSLPAGASGSTMPDGAHEALNDGGRAGYMGPCPPKGRHRYVHTLFALDTVLPDLGRRAHKADLERAMAGHVLGRATRVGMYAHGSAAADPPASRRWRARASALRVKPQMAKGWIWL